MSGQFEKDIYFTPKQAAECFNLSLSTIKNYIYAGKLRTLKTPGGHHRIRKSELLATLGDGGAPNKDTDKFYSAQLLCNSLLSLFKALGPIGESLNAHAEKVSELSSKLAEKIGMDLLDIRRVKLAGFLHDIGQIGIERKILLKPGPLAAQEYELVKKHPSIGQVVLNSIDQLQNIADIIYQHHERIDGKGYPKGIKGEKIHKASRIISVAEAYDSMVSEHSYKSPVSKETAIAELMQYRGAQFDGGIVEAFIGII